MESVMTMEAMNCIDPARINLNYGQAINKTDDERLITAEDAALIEEDSAHEKQLRDVLVANGFNNIKLIKKHGEAKIFECCKETELYAIKLAPWMRVEKEVLALTQLQGPGVERLYTSGQIENSKFGYMILERLYPLPKRVDNIQELRHITAGIMDALARIHKRNYLHRDVKPSNIMMDMNKHIKLIDFEFAMHEDAEEFDIFFGTDFYKPPELQEMCCFTIEDMRRSKRYGSAKSDTYSAALVCASLMYDIELGTINDIKTISDWLDDRILEHVATPSAVDLFRWLLEKDPTVRFSATQALHHPFIKESIINKVEKKQSYSNKIESIKRAADVDQADKENHSPNVILPHSNATQNGALNKKNPISIENKLGLRPVDTLHDRAATSVEDSAHIKQFCDKLITNGFSHIDLIKDNGEVKIFECRKDKGVGIIKIAPWRRIEKESAVLAKLRGPGIEWLHTWGQIENSTLGYLILERLYPLPKRIDSAKELQNITIDIMHSLARIHKRNYLHRDIKPSNIMMDKKKNYKLTGFEFAMNEDAEEFDIFFGTDYYKPPELQEMCCFTIEDMRRSKRYGSVKSDSYSAALVCASLMYDIELNTEDDIKLMIDWLEEGKLTHVATPSAVDLFRWLLETDPAVRFSATQAVQHPFLTEIIRGPRKTV